VISFYFTLVITFYFFDMHRYFYSHFTVFLLTQQDID